MKNILLAIAATLTFSTVAFAQVSSSADSYQGRGDNFADRGWGPGRGGPGDRDRERERDRRDRDQWCRDRWGNTVPCDNRPGPGPRPPQPQPPVQQTEYIRCESRDQRYAECYFNPRRVVAVTLARQHSNGPCIAGQTFGIQQDRIWVNNGCRATFEIRRR